MGYTVAIIGAGAWSENHLLGWRAQPDVEITWVVCSTEDGALHGMPPGGSHADHVT